MNRIPSWWWAAGGAAVLLLLAAGSGTARAETKLPQRLLVIGDSLAVGLGPHLKADAAMDRVPYVAVEAKGGTAAHQWDYKIAGLLQQHKPDTVLVVLGTNDAAMPDPTVNRQRIKKIVGFVNDSGARLVWVGMPTLPPRLKADVVRDMITSTGVDYLDSRQISFERSPDGIHATPAGYAAWARAIWSYVVKK